MSTHIMRPEARADPMGIRAYMSVRNPRACRKTIAALQRRCRQLASRPASGRLRPDLQTDLRSVVVRPYIIYFRPTPGGVEIARIIHGSRRVDPSMFPG